MAELTGYLAPDGFVADLQAELGGAVQETIGRLVLAKGRPMPVAWAENVWFEPQRLKIQSIGDAAKQLRAMQRNWALYPTGYHRRAALIVEKLPKVSAKPLVFGTPAPTAPLGSWTLVDAETILASPKCSSPFPNGAARFVEDKAAPPSRAYLKLWEAFTLTGVQPKPGETCLDLGSSPGGWSWVLAQLGARVISVDKAILAPNVSAMPNIEFRQQSAFALSPKDVGPVDWLFSDVICYPERLLTLVENWMKTSTVRRFICTIKFQGQTDFATMQKFAAVSGSKLVHLHVNKHELTWLKLS